MLDGVNAVGADGKSGGSFDSLDEIHVGGNERLVGQIDSAEDKSVILGSRFEGEGDFFPSMQGGAFERRGRGESVLHVGHGGRLMRTTGVFG